ncbi:MAG: zinc carboxypeptidase [Bacteroidetes bacterium MedPE-SWsnd-G2]|nr:MAG: zinc carboxypeptidase [Bacteroidetes bacterium MedPE-SWsnd-G2]
MKFKVLFLAIFCIQFSFVAQTSLNYYLPNSSNYNPNIPTPSSIIGHKVGEWHITHDKLVQYMYALAQSSDRISIESRGTTFEGRPLLLLKITSPENHKNLNAIKKAHIDATNGIASKSSSNRPVIVYQGFSIHGNEASGSNAALLLAYHLAASTSAETINQLNESVILFDPSLNPDGLQRFAYWANTNKSDVLNPDPNDREYDEVWPGGRTNHYWFDMNRDWLPVQLPESQARIKTFHDWLPNVLTDHHEMGKNSTFFFQPGVASRTHPLTPKMNQTLTASIAKYHASALDKIGSLYYSEEDFDDFYYGKGSTFPDLNGGIGILFEQASSRGHIQETTNGLLRFPFTIKNQLTAGLSTIEAAVAMKTELLNYQASFFESSRTDSKQVDGEGLVFGDYKDAGKTKALAEILQRQHINIHEIKNNFKHKGHNYEKGYSYFVPYNQKNYKLIKGMFEKRTEFTDSIFYDVSAWTFPLAFNVDYDEHVNQKHAGEKITSFIEPKSKLVSKSNYAYLMEWHEYLTPKAIYALMSKNIRVKVGLTPFKLNGQSYDYGTILIPVANQNLNPENLFKLIKEIANECQVNISSVNTGLTNGIDLGSNKFKSVSLPKVGLIVGDGISPYDAGEIWHLFDQRYNIPITKLDQSNLSRMDLKRYNTIILPNTYGLNPEIGKKLKLWTQNGGHLIAYRNAINWLKSEKIIDVELKKNDLEAKHIAFDQKSNYRGAQVIGGAIFETTLDRSHPINFGYKANKLPVFRNTSIFMNPDKQSYNNPIQYSKSPLLSGYISKRNLDSLASTVPFKSVRRGKGKISVFTDNTNFRAFWYGTNKLLMNAIYFGRLY